MTPAQERLSGIKKLYANNDADHTVKFLISLMEAAAQAYIDLMKSRFREYPKPKQEFWQEIEQRMKK